MHGHMFAGHAYICKHAHLNMVALHNEAMRITCIMKFGKRSYGKCADAYSFISAERNDQIFINGKAAVLQCGCVNINRKLVFFCKYRNAEYMICMLMRNKKSLYIF